MVGKLTRLPVGTQNAVQQLACLGNSADFELLAKVYGESKDVVHRDLLEAVRVRTRSPLRKAPIGFCMIVSRKRLIH